MFSRSSVDAVVFHAYADLLDAAAQHGAELRKVLRSAEDKHHHQTKYELRHAHSEYLHRVLLPGFLAFSAEHYSNFKFVVTIIL